MNSQSFLEPAWAKMSIGKTMFGNMVGYPYEETLNVSQQQMKVSFTYSCLITITTTQACLWLKHYNMTASEKPFKLRL